MRKIFLVTDYNCNNACISCAKRSDEKGKLTFQDIVQVIDSIKPTKEDYIEISGGEPTLRADLFDVINHIKSSCTTNVILLSNGRRFKDMAYSERIKATGLDRVMTTFYSHDEKIHDFITQRKGSLLILLKG